MVRLGGDAFRCVAGMVFLFVAGACFQVRVVSDAKGAYRRPGQATFTSTVVNEQGQPVTGAKVSFHELKRAGTHSGYDVILLDEIVTGADGAFSYSVPEYFGYRPVLVLVRKPGLAVGWAYWNRSADRNHDIHLGQPKELEGTVVGEDGVPIANAEVFIAGGQTGRASGASEHLSGLVSRLVLRTKTDAAGRFTFVDLPDDATFELGAQKPGYARVVSFPMSRRPQEVLQFAPGQPDIELVMPVEARIEGVVVEPASGRSVPGVTIEVKSSRLVPNFQPAPVVSGTDGTFQVGGLLSGTHTVSLAFPERGSADWVAAPRELTLAVGQTMTDLQIEAQRGGLLEMRVTEARTGIPLDETHISIGGSEGDRRFNGVSNEDGLVRMRLLPGTYKLQMAYKLGYTWERRSQEIVIESGATRQMTQELTRVPRLRGVVRDPDGRPLAGVALSVLPGAREDVYSDSEGKFEIIWDRGGWDREGTVFCLVARHEERNLAMAVEVSYGADAQDLTLKPGVTLTGRLVDTAGKAMAGAGVATTLRVSNWRAPLSRDQIEVDADGQFKIRAIPSDHRYSITARAEGHGGARTDVDTHDAVAGRLDIGTLTLPIANLSVSGRVVDTQGNPMAGMLVEVYGQGQPRGCRVETDTKGHFVLEPVCAGEVNIEVNARRQGKRLSARALTYGGISDIQIVVRSERSPVQFWGAKTYDELIQSDGKVIAGVVADEAGAPVAGVPVGVCCHKRVREDGRQSWMFSSFSTLRDTTDERGRFAIELEDDGEYNLRFSPDRHAAIIVYDIPAGKKNLRVVLPEGGTLTGRLVRWERGQKVPIAQAEVRMEQSDRTSYTHLGFDRDRTTTTDAEGRFRFEHIRTKVRPSNSRTDEHWTPVPRIWHLVYGDASRPIAFSDGTKIDDVEFLIKPNMDRAAPLMGNPLPGFDGIGIDQDAVLAEGKPVLICFFDMQQRPSRHCVLQLTRRAEKLQQQGIGVVAIEASGVESNELDQWAAENNVPFPVTGMKDDVDSVRFAWAVKSSPWLILADKSHTVRAEGFPLSELAQRLEKINGD